jgi:hypothetical protein
MPHDGKMGHLLKMVALPFPEMNMENHGKSKTCGDLSIYRYVKKCKNISCISCHKAPSANEAPSFPMGEFVPLP